MVDVNSLRILMALIRGVVPSVQNFADECARANELPGIPWSQREQIRTLEGMLNKIDQYCLDVLGKWDLAGVDNGIPEMMNELWPEEDET